MLRVRIELTTSAFLMMSSHTVYKYGALTDCATGAFTKQRCLHSLSESYKEYFERKMLRVRIELTTSAFLMMSSHTVYKYGALTDCATGAFTKRCLHSLSESYKEYFWKEKCSGIYKERNKNEDRTHNLRLMIVYKYGATGAFTKRCLHSLSESYKEYFWKEKCSGTARKPIVLPEHSRSAAYILYQNHIRNIFGKKNAPGEDRTHNLRIPYDVVSYCL
ncbi:unnamed protein product [Acanthosepion pharaonis]|uniref:Uncharacterized protein n=1 Tax=Acanthosepion pharaonis TaxID=158019 RepID=A0A812DUR6_ACAPH|nr:unnamed protein product [Sepia pharaonis]